MLTKLPVKALSARLILFGLIIFAFSCKKESGQDTNVLNDNAPDNVKSWFSQNSGQMSAPDNWMNTLTPNWNEVYSAENGNEIFYEIELNNPDKLFVGIKADVASAEALRKKSHLRLFISENKETRAITAYIMSVVNTGSTDLALKEIHHESRGTYSVKVTYYNLNGQLSHGYTQKDGKLTGYLSRRTGASKAGVNGKIAQATPGCESEYQAIYGFLCVSTGPETDLFLVTTCKWGLKRYDEIEICPDGSGGGPPNNDTQPPMSGPGSAASQITAADITDSLDNYLCAQVILGDLPNLKTAIASKISSTFQNSCTANIKFVAETMADSLDGVATSTVILNNGYNYDDGYVSATRVAINTRVLNYATKEYILTVMYHEALHAFLASEKKRLGANFSSTYPEVNPNYRKANGEIDISKAVFLTDHATMGTNFVNGLVDAIRTCNPNIPLNTAKAMASAGILEPKTVNMTLNAAERDTRTNNYKGTKCGGN